MNNGDIVKIEGKRTCRIFIERSEILFKLCKIFVLQGDASIYVVPYAKNGKYYMGVNSFSGEEIQGNFDLGKHPSSENAPHLSIHEQGEIHIRGSEGSLSGPLVVNKLSLFRGEHIASISPDSFEALPIQEGAPKGGKTVQNIAITVKPTEFSRRVVVCINGLEPKFDKDPKYHHLTIAVRRPTLPNTLFVGIFSESQDPLNAEKVGPGTTVIGGWNPIKPVDFLSIRGN